MAEPQVFKRLRLHSSPAKAAGKSSASPCGCAQCAAPGLSGAGQLAVGAPPPAPRVFLSISAVREQPAGRRTTAAPLRDAPGGTVGPADQSCTCGNAPKDSTSNQRPGCGAASGGAAWAFVRRVKEWSPSVASMHPVSKPPIRMAVGPASAHGVNSLHSGSAAATFRDFPFRVESAPRQDRRLLDVRNCSAPGNVQQAPVACPAVDPTRRGETGAPRPPAQADCGQTPWRPVRFIHSLGSLNKTAADMQTPRPSAVPDRTYEWEYNLVPLFGGDAPMSSRCGDSTPSADWRDADIRFGRQVVPPAAHPGARFHEPRSALEIPFLFNPIPADERPGLGRSGGGMGRDLIIPAPRPSVRAFRVGDIVRHLVAPSRRERDHRLNRDEHHDRDAVFPVTGVYGGNEDANLYDFRIPAGYQVDISITMEFGRGGPPDQSRVGRRGQLAQYGYPSPLEVDGLFFGVGRVASRWRAEGGPESLISADGGLLVGGLHFQDALLYRYLAEGGTPIALSTGRLSQFKNNRNSKSRNLGWFDIDGLGEYSTPGYLINGLYSGPENAPSFNYDFMRIFPFLCRAVRLDISIAEAPEGYSSAIDLPDDDERRPPPPDGHFRQGLCDGRNGVTAQGPGGENTSWIPERVYVARISASWFHRGGSQLFEPVATYCFRPNVTLSNQFDTNPSSRPPEVFTVCTSSRELAVAVSSFSDTSRCFAGTGEARVRIHAVHARVTRTSSNEPALRQISQCLEPLFGSGHN